MDTVASWDGTRIAYDRTGDGPPLILVDGAFQHRAIDPTTERLAELLSPDFTVYHHDRRGRGDSGDTLPYAVQREIEDIDALIAEVGGSAGVFGMSSGANLALEAAAQGSSIPALALYEPPMVVDDTRPPVPPDFRARLTTLIASGRPGDTVEVFLTEGVGVSPETVEQMHGAPVWQAFEAVAHTLPYDAAIVEDVTTGKPLPAERWRSVTMPTLVIDGGASPDWARNAVAALADVLPNAERATLEGQTHQYDPEVLAPLLTAFFAD
jgi:pimeloyl-ACP methyl ester carboxylesterase